jgi:PadR family transcriptional regulator, regulatory protein AphA
MSASPNRTRLALLGFLSWGPLSGYRLKQLIEISISNFWTESYGQIYPMLRQLGREGLAKARTSKGGRSRTTYEITEAGRAELARWLVEAPTPRPPRNELLLKLFFGAYAKPAELRRHLERFRGERAALAARYRETRHMLESIPKPPPHLPYWLITLSYGESEVAAQVRWADAALATLAAAPTKEPRRATHRARRR